MLKLLFETDILKGKRNNGPGDEKRHLPDSLFDC